MHIETLAFLVDYLFERRSRLSINLIMPEKADEVLEFIKRGNDKRNTAGMTDKPTSDPAQDV
jgi:hypothetical protein